MRIMLEQEKVAEWYLHTTIFRSIALLNIDSSNDKSLNELRGNRMGGIQIKDR